MAEEEKKEKGFVIKDRRIFDDTGDVRKDESKVAEAPPEEKKEKRKVFSKTEQHQEEPHQKEKEESYPEVNFASFILSLSTTAVYHFGDFPDPASNKAEVNLPAAKQTIDILGIIKTKTEGNLDENEKSLLDGILFELRMRYVKEQSKG